MQPPPAPVMSGSPLGRLGFLLVCLGFAALVRLGAQTTLYWDRVNGSGAGTGATLSGVWDTATTSNWNTNSGGTGSRTTFTAGRDAVFSAGTSATGQTYTVTVSGTQSTSSIVVEEGTVTFTGGTALNFSDATPDFTVGSGLTTTVNTDVTGSNGLTKLGAGTLVFGSGDKSYGGTTTISAGTLKLAANQTFDTVDLAGGTLLLASALNAITTLNVTADSVIDFGGANARLDVTSLDLAAGVTLTIQNWTDAADFFVTQGWIGATPGTFGVAPINQVAFAGFVPDDTKWQSYDKQVTPVPEPSGYGALLLLAAGGVGAMRRRRRR